MMHGRVKYQKAVESKPAPPKAAREEASTQPSSNEEPIPTDLAKIVEASFSGPAAEAAARKSRNRKPPPASAA
jgi:hypothetical protein